MSEQVELTCDALLARLADDLPARIASANAAITDGRLLSMPTLSFGTRAEMSYPWCQVLPKFTENTNDNGFRIHFNHRVAVTCWIDDYEEESLARKLVRYQRVIRECILEERSLPTGAGYGLQHSGDEYGPVFGSQSPGQFISWAQSIYMIQQQQDVPG